MFTNGKHKQQIFLTATMNPYKKNKHSTFCKSISQHSVTGGKRNINWPNQQIRTNLKYHLARQWNEFYYFLFECRAIKEQIRKAI